jgi:cell wall-associated NlpC family hydrolase
VLAVVALVLFALILPVGVPTTVRTEQAVAAPPRERDESRRRPRRTSPGVVPTGVRAARIALSEVGVPYVWGGESPRGFDCSGLVRYAYLRVGVSLPHSSYALAAVGRSVARSRIEPGDLLLFDGLGHVGLYVGNGRMVHAPQTGESVEVIGLSGRYASSFVAARRVAG